MPISPKLSIILPVFNAERYLAECIESLLKQTFNDFELLIIDDGSTDNSLDIIKHYGSLDERIVPISHANNIGLINVLNQSVSHCKGEYIARMDADDWSEPQRLALQVDYLDSHPKVGIVGSWIKLFGDKTEIWHYRQQNDFIKAMLLFKTNAFPHNSLVMRKHLMFQFTYDKAFKHIEDTQLWVQIMLQAPEVEFANIPKVLTHYRTYAEQVSQLYHSVQTKGYRIIIFRLLQSIVGHLTDQEFQCHYMLIDPPGFISEQAIHQTGKWVKRLSNAYLERYQDSFFVIAQRWGEFCLKYSDKKQGYHWYLFYKPENVGFTFLFEREFLASKLIQ